MQLLETTRNRDGARRYYADGKRVSRAMIVAIKGDHDLDGFITRCSGGFTRQYCNARKTLA